MPQGRCADFKICSGLIRGGIYDEHFFAAPGADVKLFGVGRKRQSHRLDFSGGAELDVFYLVVLYGIQ